MKLPQDSLLNKQNQSSFSCNTIQEIAYDMMKYSGVRRVAGVMFYGLSRSYSDSLECKTNDIFTPEIDDVLIGGLCDMMRTYLQPSISKNLERYKQYIEPIFSYGMSGRMADPSPLLSDKLTNYDMQCIFNLVCYYAACEAYIFFKNADDIYPHWKNDEKLFSIISTSDENNVASMSDSDKTFKKAANAINKTLAIFKPNISFGEKRSEIDGLGGSFMSSLLLTYFGPLSNTKFDEYLRVETNLALVLQMYLVGTLKTIFGKTLFTEKDAKFEKVKLNNCDRYSILSCIAVYSFLTETISSNIKSSSTVSQNELMISESLTSYKDIFLSVVENFEPEYPENGNTSSKDILNSVYDVLCKDAFIGKKQPKHLFLNDVFNVGSLKKSPSILNLDIMKTQNLYSKEYLNQIIADVKSARDSDTGEYFEFIEYKLQIATPAQLNQLIGSNLYNNSLISKYYAAYASACGEFNTDKLNTVFEDHSDFGSAAAFMPICAKTSTEFNTCIGGLRKVTDNVLSKVLMLLLINVHIKNDTVVKWTPNMVNLLNTYISYVSSKTLELINLDNYQCGDQFNTMSNVLNLGTILNYRNNQIPNFKYKKEGVVEPNLITNNFESTMIGNCREIIRRVTTSGMVSSREALYNGVIKYIADAVLNGTMTAEYAIFTIIFMNYRYHCSSSNNRKMTNFFGYDVGNGANGSGDSRTPFTDVVRYMISRIGEKDSEFYKAFEQSEIMYNMTVYQGDNFDEVKTSVDKLQKNLEMYIFISICQRIIMMLNFHSKISSDVNNVTIANVDKFNIMPNEIGTVFPSRTFSFSDTTEKRRNSDNVEIASIETPAIKDISNAMNIFDSLLSQNQKNYNWFEEHKSLIIGGTDNR